MSWHAVAMVTADRADNLYVTDKAGEVAAPTLSS